MFQQILEEDGSLWGSDSACREWMAKTEKKEGIDFSGMSEEAIAATYLRNCLRDKWCSESEEEITSMAHCEDMGIFRLFVLRNLVSTRHSDDIVGLFSPPNPVKLATLMSPVSEKLLSVLTSHDFSVEHLQRIFQLLSELSFQKGIPDDIRVRYADRFLDVLDADPKFAFAAISRFSKFYQPKSLRDEGFRIFPLVAEAERTEEIENSETSERGAKTRSGPNVKFYEQFEMEWQESLLNSKNRAAWAALKIANGCIEEAIGQLSSPGGQYAISNCFESQFFGPHNLQRVDTNQIERAYEYLETLKSPIEKQEAY